MPAPTQDRHHVFDRVEYIRDKEEPELSGWYIVYVADDGDAYEQIGPYDTEQLAHDIRNIIEED